MIGRNQLHLNEATMMEALEEYLNNRSVGSDIEVVAVTEITNTTPRTFKVSVDGPLPGVVKK